MITNLEPYPYSRVVFSTVRNKLVVRIAVSTVWITHLMINPSKLQPVRRTKGNETVPMDHVQNQKVMVDKKKTIT
ncbi:unnamed protein product [Brassica oleracea]